MIKPSDFMGERVIDLTHLSGRSELFVDHVHPTVAGAERIAARVSERLVAHLR